MSSRELGLILAQQLLDVEDLHYGLWESDLDLTLGNLAIAQQRYSDLLLDTAAGLLAHLPRPRILDVGCGTGVIAVMVVEHAERFGLSQLHQLRGRVGRCAERSYCVLMVGGEQPGKEARDRLAVMERTTDGFRIAEADLELRGRQFGTRDQVLRQPAAEDLLQRLLDVNALASAGPAALAQLAAAGTLPDMDDRQIEIAAHNIVWAAGVRAVGLAARVGTATDSAGRLEVGDDLTVPGFPELFVAGDLACRIDPVSGRPVPGARRPRPRSSGGPRRARRGTPRPSGRRARRCPT